DWRLQGLFSACVARPQPGRDPVQWVRVSDRSHLPRLSTWFSYRGTADHVHEPASRPVENDVWHRNRSPAHRLVVAVWADAAGTGGGKNMKHRRRKQWTAIAAVIILAVGAASAAIAAVSALSPGTVSVADVAANISVPGVATSV